jgi:hypothetical protein
MTPLAGGFAIRLFGLHIRIEAGSPAIFAALDRYLFPWLPRLPFACGEATAFLTFRMADRSDGILILRDDATEITAESVETAIPLLQSAIDEAVVGRSSDVAFVHAGVVAIGNAGILLPGLSHAGKSTLVAELVRHGAIYFSDEYAVIDAAGSVHPYPRALMLRNGAPEQRPVLPEELAVAVGTGSVSPRLILMLRFVEGQEFQVRKINHAEALMILLQSTPQVLADAPHIFGPLGRVAASAVTFSGVRGEASQAAEQIRALLAQTGPRP